jgi:hypothetical protein
MSGPRSALAAAIGVAVIVGSAVSPALGASTGSQARRLPPEAQRTLNRVARQGTDGREAAIFAQQTAPRTPRGARAITNLSPSGSAASGLGRALSGNGGGGMGWPLPVLLIVTLLAAVAFGVWRLAHRERPG